MDVNDVVTITRRDFLTTSAGGLGALAFASLLKSDGLLATEASHTNPFELRAPHFAPVVD